MRRTLLTILVVLLLVGCGTPETVSEKNVGKEITFFAMNTVMNIRLEETNQKLLNEVEKTVINIEKELSVTDENSSIFKLNSNKQGVLSEEAVKIIEESVELAKLTEGKYDPTIYPIMKLWGFTTDEYNVPLQAEIDKELQNVDYNNIVINGNEVTLLGETEVDFGGIAKGYVSDLIVQQIKDAGAKSALLELGGNVYAVGRKMDGSNWRIGIKSPTGGDVLGALQIEDQAVVTSGGYERYFEGEDGGIYWHIMDPKTGYPAKNTLQSVTIISEIGTYADVLSTALFVAGKDDAIKFWKDNKDFDMILITEEVVYITEGLKETFDLAEEYDHLELIVIEKEEAKIDTTNVSILASFL